MSTANIYCCPISFCIFIHLSFNIIVRPSLPYLQMASLLWTICIWLSSYLSKMSEFIFRVILNLYRNCGYSGTLTLSIGSKWFEERRKRFRNLQNKNIISNIPIRFLSLLDFSKRFGISKGSLRITSINISNV